MINNLALIVLLLKNLVFLPKIMRINVKMEKINDPLVESGIGYRDGLVLDQL